MATLLALRGKPNLGGDVMGKSAIEWTEETWNPTTGCNRTSPGCDNCYAMTLARRLKAMGQPKYQTDGDPRTSGPGFGLTVHPDVLDIPRTWSTPRTVFVNSMSDLFHNGVPLGFIRDVFAVVADTPQHTYQVLTKRSKRLASVADRLEWPSNLWMGVSIESDRYTFRAEHLKEVDAAVRFLSCEPLLGPLDELPLDGIHWVIVGGESGRQARPIDAEWVRSIRDQCADAEVAFFFKQWGGRTPKAGGRLLDGITYSAMPRTPVLV
jgi:protein gp37